MSARKRLTREQRWRVLNDAGEICHLCELPIKARNGELWDVSHVIPLEAGGADETDNMRPAHRTCHRAHTSAVDAPLIAKVKRQRQKALGIRKPSTFAGARSSRLKKCIDGRVVIRATGEVV